MLQSSRLRTHNICWRMVQMWEFENSARLRLLVFYVKCNNTWRATVTLIMGQRSEVATPDNSDEESGEAFTDGDFGDSDDETLVERADEAKPAHMPINEAVKDDIQKSAANGHSNGSLDEQPIMNGRKNSEAHSSDMENQSPVLSDLRRDSHGDQNPSIVGILGDQQNHVRKADC